MLVSLVDVTESMWLITDKNIECLHELIVRSTSTYFGHDEYLSTCDKVANLLYVIAKNHDFENGNKTFDFEPVTLSGADGTWDSGERTFQFNGYDTSRNFLFLTSRAND